MSSIKIEVRNLTKIFGDNVKDALELVKEEKEKAEIMAKTKATVAVNHVDFCINEGEIFVVMGLSGSGKSTLIRLLNRLIEPTAGSIILDGQDIAALSAKELLDVRRHKMSMVFQNFALFPQNTVLENTAFGLEVRGVKWEDRKAAAEKALEQAGLLAYKDQYPRQLSGGMQQRVGLARALANSPEVLLMDEAFSALDPLIRRDMQDELMELQENMKKTIIFITHDLNEALKIGDRIAIMKDGAIIQIGSGEEILTNPANEYVRRFVEGVDRTRILSVEHIMSRPHVIINIDKAGIHTAMNQMVHNDSSYLLLTNNRHEFLGYITDKDIALSIKHKGTRASYQDVIKKNIHTVSFDTPIPKIYKYLLAKDLPVVVLEGKKIRGIITRRNIIELLSAMDVSKASEVNEG